MRPRSQRNVQRKSRYLTDVFAMPYGHFLRQVTDRLAMRHSVSTQPEAQSCLFGRDRDRLETFSRAACYREDVIHPCFLHPSAISSRF